MFKVINYLLLICISSCSSSVILADNRIPVSKTSFQGQWLVEHVLVDQKSDNGLPPQYYIPKYLGRIIDLSPSLFTINKPADATCERPNFHKKKLLLSQLIAQSIHSRAYEKNSVLINDIQLNTTEKIVDAYYLYCNQEARVKDYGMAAEEDLSNVVWLVKLNDNQLAMSWHDQTILILSPLQKKQPIAASFPCEKAQTTIEKKICSDVALAAFDQSVSQTYRASLKYYQSLSNKAQLTNNLKQEQRKWLKTRNECTTDTLCLRTQMDKRIDDLIYDLTEVMYEQR